MRAIGNFDTAQFAQAQQFTTGSAAGGYELASVQLHIDGFEGADAVRVSICSDSSGSPGRSLFVLTNLSSITNGSLNTFTAPANTALAIDSNYFVVVEATSGIVDLGVARRAAWTPISAISD